MMSTDGTFTKARNGFFWGLDFWQAVVVALSLAPLVSALTRLDPVGVGVALLAPVTILLTTVLRINGKSAVGWVGSVAAHLVSRVRGSHRFASKATEGSQSELDVPDLPGELADVAIHEAPPSGPLGRRIAMVENPRQHTWSITASITHPGLDLCSASRRANFARGLEGALNGCASTGLVRSVLFLEQAVPDDGAERQHWVGRHRDPNAPAVAQQIVDAQDQASRRIAWPVRSYITLVIGDDILAREARKAGGGLAGRGRVLARLADEVGALFTASLGLERCTWLTSPDLSAACRLGFAPGDRASIVDALLGAAGQPADPDPVPWALAGPSGAESCLRYYSHDAWNSISSAVVLPRGQVQLGTLAAVLRPSHSAERRSLLVAFPLESQAASMKAGRHDQATLEASRTVQKRLGLGRDAGAVDHQRRAAAIAEAAARGAQITKPYAVVTTTVPKTENVHEYGRLLDASVRACQLRYQRLDAAQDRGFLATCIPMGVDLAQRPQRWHTTARA